MRVTCRACGAVKLHDLEELIAERLFQRKTADWLAVQHDLRCLTCHEPRDVTIAGVPYGRNERELRERRARTLLMNLALTVLRDAARRAKDEDVCTPAVRLALRVLRPYLADRALLVTFWTDAKENIGRPWGGAHQAHRWIVTALIERGHAVWAEFR